MRYQQWYYYLFRKELKKYFEEVVVLGNSDSYSLTSDSDQGSFSKIDNAIQFECKQVEEFRKMELKEDDTLLLGDLSFPGIFSNILFHKPIKNMYAICHATSINKYDIFQQQRKSKWQVETGHSKLFKKIFIGSEYHQKKLGWKNTVVTYLPFPPSFLYSSIKKNVQKNKQIISVTRPGIQKTTSKLEKEVKKKFGAIYRNNFTTWSDYYQYISESKILLSTAKEETFGYQIVDAILGGAIPIVPNSFSYPELLPKEYMYNNKEELIEIIQNALNGNLKVPTLLCREQMTKFFENISTIMIQGLIE